MADRPPVNPDPFASAAVTRLADGQAGLFRALLGAAALVACADGEVKSVEGGILVDCLDRQGMLDAVSRRDILDAFAACIERLERPEGIAALLADLRGQAQAPAAQLLLDIGAEIAGADGIIDRREREALTLIRDAVGLSGAP